MLLAPKTSEAKEESKSPDFRRLQLDLHWCYPLDVSRVPKRKGGFHNHKSGIHQDNHFNYFSVWYVEQGEIHISTRRGEVVGTEGHWLCCPMGDSQRFFSPECRGVSIAFSAVWPNGKPLFDLTHPIQLHEKETTHLSASTDTLLAAVNNLFEHNNWLSQIGKTQLSDYLSIQALFFSWLSHYTQWMDRDGIQANDIGTNDTRFYKALQVLENWPFTEPFDTESLAQQMGISAIHLNRLFLRYHDKSIHKTRDSLRLNQAITSLTATDKQTKEIAYELGFSHPCHFTRWFKQRQKMTPNQFRERKTPSHV